MENGTPITREKHLDHMTRVVPFIVFCYAVQSYVVYRISPTEFSRMSLFVLGCFLAAMVASFVTYDLKHKVTIFEDHLIISFFGQSKMVFFTDIESIMCEERTDSFSTLKIKTNSGKHHFYFIDGADKVKKFIEEKKQIHPLAA